MYRCGRRPFCSSDEARKCAWRRDEPQAAPRQHRRRKRAAQDEGSRPKSLGGDVGGDWPSGRFFFLLPSSPSSHFFIYTHLHVTRCHDLL